MMSMMKLFRLLLLLAFLSFRSVAALKFLAYVPMCGRSHVNFLATLVHTLADAGHQVVVVAPRLQASGGDPHEVFGRGSGGRIRVIEIGQASAARRAEDAAARRRDGSAISFWRTAMPLFEHLRAFLTFSDAWVEQCQATLQTSGLVDALKSEAFDAAFMELMDVCGLGLFHLIGIDKFALAQSQSVMVHGFPITGAPSAPSYVPGMMSSFGEKMSFSERAENFFYDILSSITWAWTFDAMQTFFQQRYLDFPLLETFAANASLVFLNAEPLVDFPRLTTHKIIDIGGVTIRRQQLDVSWHAILRLRPSTVLISFGTVSPSHGMPDECKRSIREAARQLPNATFVWKYEREEERVGRGVDNLLTVKWMPQSELLYDPRVAAFVTHGGQASVLESAAAGVPVVVVPLAADQFRNGAAVERAGRGVVVQKEAFGRNERSLVEALRRVLGGDASIKASARRYSSMIASRPFSPRALFLRNMELLARHGPLDSLRHAGVRLSLPQYFLVDVAAVVTVAAVVILYSFYALLALLCRLGKKRLRKLDCKRD